MPRKPQSRGTCQYCGEETAKSGMTRHLAKCGKRAQTIQATYTSKQPEETLWHVRVQGVYGKDFWLDLEMRGSATLEKLDVYLRAIWLECCGHLCKFTVGSWQGYDVGKARTADNVFARETELLHLYDFGTTSETEIKVVGSRQGNATTKHPIALMARNNMPEMLCKDCDKPATYLCIECLYEADQMGTWFLCDEHAEDHPHTEYGEPVALVNSPRLGMCGYEGPAEPPY
ncbi:MAG: hypothetical protein L0287_29715 [Anaerolineae bacterium]|nr:hypothetical protein [Anaerolineae bacterium]MCI0607885.1 hypothetical protein [Anaerolineae bacterium]